MTPSTSPFRDVSPSHAFFRSIAWLADVGVSTGYDVGAGEREFRPSDPVLREQMAAFLYRLAGSPSYAPPATSPFTDVSVTHPFYREIAWLAGVGISTGYDLGAGVREFRPSQPVLREQMAAFMARLAGHAAPDAPAEAPFLDVQPSAVFYRQIAWLGAQGISRGYAAETGREYRPSDLVLREQMAAFMYRLAPRLTSRAFSVVSAGRAFTCGLEADSGRPWCWGYGYEGQLGSGTDEQSPVPVPVDTSGVLDGRRLVQIVAGDLHTCALDDEGHAYCWGYGKSGQLGDGSVDDSLLPTTVVTGGALHGHVLTTIDLGREHTCALDANGAAFCWGANGHGQLGDGTWSDALNPVPVRTDHAFVAISAGTTSTCAVDVLGQVYCWGAGAAGQLGDGTLADSNIPTAVDVAGVLGGATATSVTAGRSHACALDSTGHVSCWGGIDPLAEGVLGDGTWSGSPGPALVLGPSDGSDPELTAVSAGDWHTCGLSREGRAMCWGQNYLGLLGAGTSEASPVPIAVDDEGVLLATVLVQVSAGGDHTCALDSQGHAYCWGSDGSGGLGDGFIDGRYSDVPVAVVGG